MSKFHVPIFNTFPEISHQTASQSGIVLNDLAGPKEGVESLGTPMAWGSV